MLLFETAEHCVVGTVVCCFVRNGCALCCRNGRVLFCLKRLCAVLSERSCAVLFETAERCVVGTVVCCFVRNG